jgi:hypothetical protein
LPLFKINATKLIHHGCSSGLFFHYSLWHKSVHGLIVENPPFPPIAFLLHGYALVVLICSKCVVILILPALTFEMFVSIYRSLVMELLLSGCLLVASLCDDDIVFFLMKRMILFIHAFTYFYYSLICLLPVT